MAWIKRKPGYLGSIEDVERRSETVSGQQIIRAYARLFAHAGNRPPAYREIDLRDITSAIPFIALISVKPGVHCTIRFFGEELRRRVALNPSGRNLLEFIHPERSDSVRRMMEMIVRQPCGYLAHVKQEFLNGRNIVVETIAFPLRASRADEDGQVLLTDTPIKDEGISFDREKVLLSADVLRRDLIDLGFGVDEDFYDLVTDPDGRDR